MSKADALLDICVWINLTAILWRLQSLESWRKRLELEHADENLVAVGLDRTLNSKLGE